jgi:hypothetical protein
MTLTVRVPVSMPAIRQALVLGKALQLADWIRALPSRDSQQLSLITAKYRARTGLKTG